MDKLNPFPKPEAEQLIRKTVAILDRYGKLYEQLSGGRLKDYESYMASDGFADEDEFIKPKLFTDFLREVLGFPSDEYSPERSAVGGVPDFQPCDTLLHPFFFEVKPSNAIRLDEHEPQVKRYLRPPFRWGVLTNMRDVLVYDIEHPGVLDTFSLLQLHRDQRNQPRTILDSANTRRFLELVEKFRHKTLDQQQKIERIRSAPPWNDLSPAIVPEELKATIQKVVGFLSDDARRFAHDIPRLTRDPERRESLTAELEDIARELDHRYRPGETDRLNRFLDARPGTLEERALSVFLDRVAYYAMTRFLIARMWEDVRFIPQILYDGGFGKWYEQMNRSIREVLRLAFNYAGEQYSWLYDLRHSNYWWYDRPSEETIVDVLYEFARYNLGKLDTDVLGTVYEEFVDRVDRKNKGQFYTPRPIIKLIWDRVGFTNEAAFFRYENGCRLPKMILDVGTGSGGFLVEAAWRIRTQSKYNPKDANELLEILAGICDGLWGADISFFAHYITEVNLLIQLTPLIRQLVDTERHPEHILSLRTIPYNSLALAESPRALFPNDPVMRDRIRTVLPYHAKERTISRFKELNDFDYVCSNPPYVGEKDHKELFQDTRREYPFWEKHYQGKMDYSYWFIILGLHKLREGGKLGFITMSSWLTADGASHLREYILENALIAEVVDFGSTRVFDSAPGQFNMVFVLEKCRSQMPNNSSHEGQTNKANVERKQKHRIKVVKVKAVPPAGPGALGTAIERAIAHVNKYVDRAEHSDDYVDVQLSSVTQSELNSGPWSLFVDRRSQTVVDRLAAQGILLKEHWNVYQGVVPNPLRITESRLRELPPGSVQEHNLQPGDGVFVLSTDELGDLSLGDAERKLIRPYYKNSDIMRFVTSETPDDFLIYTTKETELDSCPTIQRHLEVFRPILAKRRECEQGKIPWFSLHWSREESIFEGPKVVCSYRSEGASFAYNDGSFYGSTDMYFIRPKAASDQHSLKYLTAVLNSPVIDFWLAHKGKPKGEATEQFSTPLENIPIRRINFGDKREVKRHDRIVSLVDDMIAAKHELAELNRYFPERLTRLSGPDELPEPNAEAITRSLPGPDLRRVRNHPKVQADTAQAEGFVLSRVGDIESAADLFSKQTDEPRLMLRLHGKGRKEIPVTARKEILKYLRLVLERHPGLTWDEIKELPVAKDLATHQAKEKEVVSEARALLKKVQALQSKIDAEVYELYDLTPAEIKTIEARGQ